MYTNATPQADGRARRPWRFLKPLMFGGIGVLALLAGGDTAGAASVKARVKAGVLTVTGTGASEEITLIGLHNAIRYLGEITGETTTEDMLSRIFETFCIGK